jgi:hypothetical protein
MSAIGDEVMCRQDECGHPFTRHDPGGGHCWDCGCAGFRWVDPAGERVGSYSEPPRPV